MGVQTNPAKGPYLCAGIPSDQAQFAAGTAGPGRLPRAGTGSPPPPPPPPQAPRPFGGPEEGLRDPGTGAARAGGGGSCGARRGGAGVSAEPRPGRGRESAYPGEQRQLGMAPPTPFLLGPAPELELVLDTLSGRWRGSLSEPGQDSPVTSGPANPESLHSKALSRPKLPGAPRALGFLGPLRLGVRRPWVLGPRAAGGALRPAAPLLPSPRPASRRAARGRQDSLHVASAATIQPLIER